MDIAISARIATDILCWKRMGNGSGIYWAPEKNRTQMLCGSEIHSVRKTLDIEPDEPGDGFCVDFGGNLADAWQVVEAMGKLQPPGHAGPAMLHRLRQCAPGGWEAQFCSDFGLVPGPACASPAEALCLAAVRAMKLDINTVGPNVVEAA